MSKSAKSMTRTIQASERPKEKITIKKTFNFRVNRALAGVFNFFYRKGLPYHALNSPESLEMLLKTKRSYIRFGNGESEILVGLDMFTQTFDMDLKAGLMKIIKDYSPDCGYLLGLTNWRLTKSVSELKETPGKQAFKIWRFMRYMFWRLGMHKIRMPVLEADMFRNGPAALPLEKIELLWEDVSHIIMLYNNEETYNSFAEKHKSKKVHFVKIPDKNFYGVHQTVQEKIVKIIQEGNISTGDLAVLVSAGPGANIICYNLSRKYKKIRCYDMGNFFHIHYKNNF